VPTSSGQRCDGNSGSCSPETDGYLTRDHDAVTWDGNVSLGTPFTVRAPVIAWGMGRYLIGSTPGAIGFVVLSLMLELLGGAFVLVPLILLWEALFRR
jgi:uncharacterized protein (DUF779 family)